MHIFCGQAFEQNCGAGARFYLPPGAGYTLHVIEELLSRGVEPV